MPTTRKPQIVERLKQELVIARGELAEYEQEAANPPEADLGGGTSGYEAWQAAVVLKEHLAHEVQEIETALARAEAGLYGICERCGAQIPEERMEALPFTTHCVACASALAAKRH